MTVSPSWTWARLPAGALVLLFGVALTCQGDPGCGCEVPRCLEQLQHLGPCELAALYTRAELGHPIVGVARGRLLYLTDDRLPRVKVGLANAVWRGKAACEDGSFANRWIGGRAAIGSRYVIGPSWVDGRPAVIMEYAPGTPLFANMHDELREISPGLYMGPVYERFPCPKLRGYVALQLECCSAPKCCGH
jgi:hypothetical protein